METINGPAPVLIAVAPGSHISAQMFAFALYRQKNTFPLRVLREHHTSFPGNRIVAIVISRLIFDIVQLNDQLNLVRPDSHNPDTFD